MSDLQVWDYYHKEDSTQETEEPTELDLDGALTGDLEVALENSLSLRVAPALKRAAWRRMGTAEWKAQEESQKKKRTSRNVRTRLRRKHRARLVKAFAEKLKLPGSGSRQEALQDLVPEAKQKKGKKKLSEVLKQSLKKKASAKTKPSLKNKLSAKTKLSKKHQSKALADKALKEAEPAPLPPPAEAPPTESDDILLNKTVVVVSEAAGALAFGKQGLLTFVSDKGFYTLVTDKGVFRVRAEWVKEIAEKKQPVPWPKWSQLSKKDLRLLLSQMNCSVEDDNGLAPVEWNRHTVLPFSKTTNELEDQHMWLGWCLLSWAFYRCKLPSFDALGVACSDPILSHLLEKQVEGAPQQVAMEEGIRATATASTKLLLVPVYAHFHWTLLVAERMNSEAPWVWRRYDSLSQEHAESHPVQLKIGNLIDPEFQLPVLSNVAKQPVGSNACGNYVLHYIEQELRAFAGYHPSVWPLQGWKDWTQRLSLVVPKLEAEYNAVTQQQEAEHKSFLSQQEQVAKALKKAQDALAKIKTVASLAYVTAQEAVTKNSVKFTWQDLSASAKQKVYLLEHSVKICAKCRWSSSCLECDPYKCLRYHLHKEAAKAKKLAFLSKGPGFFETVCNVFYVFGFIWFFWLCCCCCCCCCCSCLVVACLLACLGGKEWGSVTVWPDVGFN